MARAGDTISSPRTRILFRITSADSDGALLAFEQWVQPGAQATIPHIHPRQSERFVVLGGVMGARVAGEDRHLLPGDEVTA